MPRTQSLRTSERAGGECVARKRAQHFRAHAKRTRRLWTQRRGAVRLRQERRCSSWPAGIAPEALAPEALTLLKRAEAAASVVCFPGSPEEAVRSYSSIIGILRQLQAFAEPEMRLWNGKVADLEARLRMRALDIWDSEKVHIAKTLDKDSVRCDLLRPPAGEVTCSKIWAHLRRLNESNWNSPHEMLVALLADLSGCTRNDAQQLWRYVKHSSEHFAPVELAHRIARQGWSGRKPFALGVALLPLLEQAIRKLASERTATPTQQQRIGVVVLGGCCITAALASRLGCEVILLENRPLVRQMLEAIVLDNGLDVLVLDASKLQDAISRADVIVWEGVDDDSIFELGYLTILRSMLKERSRLQLNPPRLVPARLRIAAAPVDDAISSVRGCNLSHFDNLRVPELCFSHRWPCGACHVQPILRAAAQVVWDVNLEKLIDEPELHIHEMLLSFFVEAGERITGMAFWIDAPSGNSAPSNSDCSNQRIGLPVDAWIACVHQLPPRRAISSGLFKFHAARSESRMWFEWSDDASNASTPIGPCISKARLPQWHFKMLNDHERNRRYESAIERAVRRASARKNSAGEQDGPSVLDCGCGAGLLSLFAARAGASNVRGLEVSVMIGDVSKQSFAGYLQERRTREMSNEPAPSMDVIVSDVRTLDAHQIGKYDLIVSELMDASGLGESLLSVLQCACHSFAKQDAQVIPCEIEIHAAIGWLRLPECHGSLSFKTLDPLWFCASRGGPFAVDAAGSRPDALRCGAGEKTPNTPTLHSSPFTSRNTNRLKRGEEWDLLTSEVLIKRFDIASALRGEWLFPSEDEVEVVISENGVANCLHWWWTAKLDEATSISNRPLESGGMYETHWHQPFEPLGPLPVQTGDRLRLKMSLTEIGQKMAFSVRPAEPDGASAWLEPPHLPPEPLTGFLSFWKEELDKVSDGSASLTNQFTKIGDVRGLASLQRAIMVICICPSLFKCDPHVRDRLLQTWYGMTM